MRIKNGLVYGENHTFEARELWIKGERIVSTLEEPNKDEVLDASGCYVIPGLVDIHFHGAVGHDFCDADMEGLQKIAEYEAKNGVLAICPATMTFSEEILGRVCDVACQFAQTEAKNCADLVGINMEGPFISPRKLGAQNGTYVMKPDAEMLARLQERADGLIRLVDLAPEVEGGLSFIEKCHDQVNVSLAHNEASYEIAVEAFQKGARHMTHLYNAMPGISHRAPGPVIAAYEAGAEVELIADGIHIHPAMVRFTFAAFGADKVILVSDTMEATGLADGTYQLGGQAVQKTGKKAVLADQGNVIAGSVTNLYDCMVHAVWEMGVPLEQAVRAATENPARSIGVEADYGSLAPGHYANVLILNKNLELVALIHRGTSVKKG